MSRIRNSAESSISVVLKLFKLFTCKGDTYTIQSYMIPLSHVIRHLSGCLSLSLSVCLASTLFPPAHCTRSRRFLENVFWKQKGLFVSFLLQYYFKAHGFFLCVKQNCEHYKSIEFFIISPFSSHLPCFFLLFLYVFCFCFNFLLSGRKQHTCLLLAKCKYTQIGCFVFLVALVLYLQSLSAPHICPVSP